MPASEPRLIHGLEVWLVGTRSQIEQALGGLRAVMGIAPGTQPRPLDGGDTGRFAMYVRGFPTGAVPPTPGGGTPDDRARALPTS